jgi:hypothetical protein
VSIENGAGVLDIVEGLYYHCNIMPKERQWGSLGSVDLGTLYVIQWNAHERVIMVAPAATMIEKNLAAYEAGECGGFYPIAFAVDRDHAEEVYNKISAERDRLCEEMPVNVEDAWLQ